MKAGIRVRHIVSGRIGTSSGPVNHFGVLWIKVSWDDDGAAYILEEMLEVISD